MTTVTSIKQKLSNLSNYKLIIFQIENYYNNCDYSIDFSYKLLNYAQIT